MNIVSVTDLRQDATNILNKLANSHEPAYVVQNSELKAILLNPTSYQTMQETIEDYIDVMDSQTALAEPGETDINEYARKRFGNGSKTKTQRRKRTR